MFDVLTIAAVADELTAALLDGRVQRVGLIDARTIALEVYGGGRRRTLIASADDRAARLLLSDTEPPIDTALITPLLLLLRKYVRGGIIVGIDQPPLERIVRLSIAKRLHPKKERAEDPEPVPDAAEGEADDAEEIYGVEEPTFVHLHVEIMGRHSNLILVDDEGRIMEAAKRVTPRMSRVRPIAPRLPFVDPPALDRPDPRRATADSLGELLLAAPATGELAGWLVRAFRGVSPQMAREVAFQATGDAGAALDALRGDAPGEIARALRHLFEPMLTGSWAPRVYRDEEGDAVAFAPIPMAHLAAELREEAAGSISAAAEAVMSGGAEAPGRHGARRERLIAAIRSARDRVAARLASLDEEERRSADMEQYRTWGDLIYAYLWMIQPGQERLEAEGMSIPLDPSRTPSENAQAYYERYKKGRGAAEHLPELIELARVEAAYLDQLMTQVAQAETFPDIEALQAEWDRYRVQAGLAGKDARARQRKAAPARRVRPLYDDDGNAVYIGRSGAQNDEVTFDIAGPNDTWLHARGVPGSHVVVRWRNPAGEEDPATVEAAARLAAYYSAGRASGQVEVDVARRRHVRKIKGAGPGMVTYRNERTIAVRPADEESLARLLAPAATR